MNKTRKMIIVVCAAASVFNGACASFQTKSIWGPAQKLSGLGSSFVWKPGAKCEPDASNFGNSSEIDAAIQGLVEADLNAKGYRKIDGKGADFSVCYRKSKREREEKTQLGTWDEATLGVDIEDPSTGGLIWRGSVSGRIDYSAAPGARKGRLESAIRQLMQPIPEAGSQ